MTTTTLLHRLRTLLGGDLGNEAADEIERMAKEVYQHKAAAFTWEQKYRSVAAYGSLGWTIETVSQWLETQGLCAVSKTDARMINEMNAATSDFITHGISITRVSLQEFSDMYPEPNGEQTQ
jgi:hypothetical protein